MPKGLYGYLKIFLNIPIIKGYEITKYSKSDLYLLQRLKKTYTGFIY